MNKENFEFKEINSKHIMIDRLYQRELDGARVSRIVKNFDARLVNPIKVSFRDGVYYVFDGQHTLAALKARNKNKDLMVLCKVYYGLTWLDESMLFVEQNGISSKVHMNDKFKALFNAGDPDVVGMVRCTEKCGFHISFTSGKAANRIVALTTLFKIYKSRTQDEFCKVLNIIKKAWGGTAESLDNTVLKGVSMFCKTYAGVYNEKALIKRLSATNPIEIGRDGKMSGAPGDSKYARVVLRIYNSRTTSKRLPDLL